MDPKKPLEASHTKCGCCLNLKSRVTAHWDAPAEFQIASETGQEHAISDSRQPSLEASIKGYDLLWAIWSLRVRILQAMISEIRLLLGLGTRRWDPHVHFQKDHTILYQIIVVPQY